MTMEYKCIFGNPDCNCEGYKTNPMKKLTKKINCGKCEYPTCNFPHSCGKRVSDKEWKEDLFKHFGLRRHTTKDCDHTLEEWVEEKKKEWEKEG